MSRERQLSHFKTLFKSFSYTDFPKVFKGLLADFFSLSMGQERPVVPIKGDYLFYPRYKTKVFRALNSSMATRVRVLWDLMQSKALAMPVDESFVKETLIKHRETVSRVTQTPKELLQEFSKFCEPWAHRVIDLLPDVKAPIPGTSASYCTPRSKGGVRSEYSLKKDSLLQPDKPRLDPTTVVLCGPPGVGKSLIQAKLAQKLQRYLGGDWHDIQYSRNSACKHWDGYRHQPLVMIDDFLQVHHKVSQESVEAIEFIQLNSTVDVRLPMAELKEKGMLFTSPLILYSTNMNPKSLIWELSRQLSSLEACSRRVSLAVRYQLGRWEVGTIVSSELQHGSAGDNGAFKVIKALRTIDLLVDYLFSYFLSEWTRKSLGYEKIFERYTHIQIGSDVSITTDTEDHNRVRVCPIVEPLKVRTVTVGTARNYLLKPLQEAMLTALRAYPEFKPCFTPDYREEIKSLLGLGSHWLSGDYSSATDGVHQDLFLAGLKPLIARLDPGLRELVEREASPHLCQYPKQYDIEDVYQTNGQLMGSLLSFPLLCLMNAFTLHKATGRPLGELPGLIHGDDLLARVDRTVYKSWREFCPLVGLQLSVGKNYFHPVWGSIDSQVFYGPDCIHLGTGKFGVLKSLDLNAVWRLLSRGVPKALVVSVLNRSGILTSTPRSLDVDIKYGGLGFEGEPESFMDYVVFARKVFSTFARKTMPGGFLYSIHPTYKDLVGGDLKEVTFDLPPLKPFDDFKFIKMVEKKGWVCPPIPVREVEAVCLFTSEPNPRLENLVEMSRKLYTALGPTFSF